MQSHTPENYSLTLQMRKTILAELAMSDLVRLPNQAIPIWSKAYEYPELFNPS